MLSFGRKKDPFSTVVCKGRKIDGNAAKILAVAGLDFPALIKGLDASELCSKISFGQIYQKPGSMLAEHNAEDQGYSAKYDKITRSIGIALRQGLMRQTVVIGTKEPQALAAEIGLTLEVDAPPAPAEPTAE